MSKNSLELIEKSINLLDSWSWLGIDTYNMFYQREEDYSDCFMQIVTRPSDRLWGFVSPHPYLNK